MKNRKTIDDILSLLDDVDKQSPSEDLIRRIQERTIAQYAKPREAKIIRLSKGNLMGIAASLLLLVMVNVYAVTSVQESYTDVSIGSNNSYDLLAIQSLYND
jgi:hypothetical protein